MYVCFHILLGLFVLIKTAFTFCAITMTTNRSSSSVSRINDNSASKTETFFCNTAKIAKQILPTDVVLDEGAKKLIEKCVLEFVQSTTCLAASYSLMDQQATVKPVTDNSSSSNIYNFIANPAAVNAPELLTALPPPPPRMELKSEHVIHSLDCMGYIDFVKPLTVYQTRLKGKHKPALFNSVVHKSTGAASSGSNAARPPSSQSSNNKLAPKQQHQHQQQPVARLSSAYYTSSSGAAAGSGNLGSGARKVGGIAPATEAAVAAALAASDAKQRRAQELADSWRTLGQPAPVPAPVPAQPQQQQQQPQQQQQQQHLQQPPLSGGSGSGSLATSTSTKTNSVGGGGDSSISSAGAASSLGKRPAEQEESTAAGEDSTLSASADVAVVNGQENGAK
jgi:hypothetical protein